MRILLAVVVVLAACAPGDVASTTTVPPRDTTTTTVAATTSTPSVTTTTAPLASGYLVRLDPETLQPEVGYEPIPLSNNSWSLMSRDGSVMVRVECDPPHALCDGATGIDLVSWESWGTVDVGPHTAQTVEGSSFYGYDGRFGSTGRGLFRVDLVTGVESSVGEWPHSLNLWDGLHVLPGGQIAALAHLPTDVVSGVVDNYSVHLYDPESQQTTVIEVGQLTRTEEHSGVFDGEYEIPIWGTPGLAWAADRLFIAHAESLEIAEVDLVTGEVDNHALAGSSWWDRLWAFWMPTASAKGPSLGTYSSAALSPDGRYLYVSGNRSDVVMREDGVLVEEQEHLGLTVVDTETWNVVATPEFEIQFVRNAGDAVIGVNNILNAPWVDDYYLFVMGESGGLSHWGPFTSREGGCDPTPDAGRVMCSGSGRVELVDVATMETIADLAIGYEDTVHAVTVVQDARPLNLVSPPGG